MEVAGAAGTTGPEVLWSALVGQRSHWARCPPPVTVAVTIPRGNPWAFKDSEGEGLALPTRASHSQVSAQWEATVCTQASCREGHGIDRAPGSAGPAEQKQLGKEGLPSLIHGSSEDASGLAH